MVRGGVRTRHGQRILTATHVSNSHVRWASVTPDASPERNVDEEVDAQQRGRSPTVLGCGRLELKKRPRSPEKRDDRSGRDGRDAAPWVLPGKWCGGAHPESTTRTRFWRKGRCTRSLQVRQACRAAQVGAGHCFGCPALRVEARAQGNQKGIARMWQPEIRSTGQRS